MSYGSMLHIPPTDFLLITTKQKPYKKAYLLTKNIEEFSGKSSGEWTSRQKKDKTERITGLGRKTGEEIVKVESNDSPEIPDQGETSDIRSLPLGVIAQQHHVLIQYKGSNSFRIDNYNHKTSKSEKMATAKIRFRPSISQPAP